MELSVDRMREGAMDAIGTTGGHLVDLIEAGAQIAESRIETGADRAPSTVAEWADRSPRIALEVVPRRTRHGARLLVLVVAVVAGGLTLWAVRSWRRERPTANANHLDVVRSGSGTWEVQHGLGKPLSNHPTQAEAIEQAGQWARDHGGGEVIVHGMDGTPRETKSFDAAGAHG